MKDEEGAKRGTPRRFEARGGLLLATLALMLTTTALATENEPASEQETEERASFSEAVVVTANRGEQRLLEVPAHVTPIDMEELDRGGFQVAADELRGQPGLFFRRGEGDNDSFLFINIRGVVGNHGNDTFLALLDGVPFVGPDEEVLMTEIPYAAVGEMELVRGPVSVLYGRGALGGAINYRLLDAGQRTTLRLSGGSEDFVRGQFNLGRTVGEHSLFLSTDGTTTDGWRESLGQDRLTLFGRGIFQLAEGLQLNVFGNYYDREFELGSVIPTLADGTIVEINGGRRGFNGSREIFTDTSSTMATARLQYLPSADLQTDFTVHYRDRSTTDVLDFYDFFGFDPERGVMAVNGFDAEGEAEVAFVDGQVSWSSDRVRLLAGGSYERASLVETDRWTGQFGFTFECGFAFYLIEIELATGRVLNADHPCFVEGQHNLSGDTDNTFSAAFLQAEFDLGDRWAVTLGARYDRFERQTRLVTGEFFQVQPEVDVDEDNVAPKVSISFAPSTNQSLYFAFGEGFNSNFGPIWQWDPSRYIRDTRPTTLRSYELGWKAVLANGKLDLNTAIFDLDQRDRLIFVNNPEAANDFTIPPTIATTGQRYSSQGVELSLRWRATSRTAVDVRGSWVDPEWDELILNTFSGPLDLSGTAPTGVPQTQAYLGLDQRLSDRWLARLWWEYYDDYEITVDNQFSGGGYDLLNAAVSYQPSQPWLTRVDLSVTNLLDNEYYYFFGGSRTMVTNVTPGLPLQARLTLSLDF
ncbi:MAG: TonB-dependent receptor [Acidobacteriota bacterium]